MFCDNDEAMDVEMESTSLNNKPSTSSGETSDLEINNISTVNEQNKPSTSKQKLKTKEKFTRYGKLSLPIVLQSVGCDPNKYEEVSGKMKKRCPDQMELLSKS